MMYNLSANAAAVRTHDLFLWYLQGNGKDETVVTVPVGTKQGAAGFP